MPTEHTKEEKYICTVRRRGGPAPEDEAVLHRFERLQKKKNGSRQAAKKKSNVLERKRHPGQKSPRETAADALAICGHKFSVNSVMVNTHTDTKAQ